MTPHEKFLAARTELTSTLIERDEEVTLGLVALAAGEHLLLVGPPGTAKSMLCQALARFAGGTLFDLLTTKFTSPEEVFGPYDLRLLKEGRFERVTAGYLPTADFCFLDEIFKSSSAVLNTLLRVLNEGTFKNGTTTEVCPLKLCVAASNEWPAEENGQRELGALFDRFLIRTEVKPIRSRDGREKLLYADDIDLTPIFKRDDPAPPLIPGDLDTARALARAVSLSDGFKECFGKCLDALREAGVSPGDRRLRKAVKVARAQAWLNGHAEVEPEDGEVLAHVLWDDPVGQRPKVRQVVAETFNPAGATVAKALAEAEEVVNGTNPRDLGEVMTASKKLREIADSLQAVKPSARRDTVLKYVKDSHKQLAMKSTEI